jgi:hypothetical protein
MSEIKEGMTLIWRWKGSDNKTWSKSFVQNVIEVDDDSILELRDNDIWTAYPTRICLSEIQYKITKP